MIASVSIDAEGNVHVSVDSDGDQGDHYSTDVVDDALSRAATEALSVWLGTRDHITTAEAADDDEHQG